MKNYQYDITYIYSFRWIVIHKYLSTLHTKHQLYDNVFICDAHDTLFQTDIFAYMNGYAPGLYAFIEADHMKIGHCQTNKEWLLTCYGEAEAKKLFSKPISCSGTVLGTWSAIMSYLFVMESEILSRSEACKDYGGSDQGIHNYIIYNNKISEVTIHHISNEYGFVGTLGYVLSWKRNQFGLVLNANGSVYAVIHQWNRSGQMKAQFQREYQIIPADIRDKKDLIYDDVQTTTSQIDINNVSVIYK